MTINTSPNTSDAFNSFELLKGDWEKFNWYLQYVDVDGAPIPAAIWVGELLGRFGFTYNELNSWLQASAEDPKWECAIYAGFDSNGNSYIVAKNVDVS